MREIHVRACDLDTSSLPGTWVGREILKVKVGVYKAEASQTYAALFNKVGSTKAILASAPPLFGGVEKY